MFSKHLTRSGYQKTAVIGVSVIPWWASTKRKSYGCSTCWGFRFGWTFLEPPTTRLPGLAITPGWSVRAWGRVTPPVKKSNVTCTGLSQSTRRFSDPSLQTPFQRNPQPVWKLTQFFFCLLLCKRLLFSSILFANQLMLHLRGALTSSNITLPNIRCAMLVAKVLGHH